MQKLFTFPFPFPFPLFGFTLRTSKSNLQDARSSRGVLFSISNCGGCGGWGNSPITAKYFTCCRRSSSLAKLFIHDTDAESMVNIRKTIFCCSLTSLLVYSNLIVTSFICLRKSECDHGKDIEKCN